MLKLFQIVTALLIAAFISILIAPIAAIALMIFLSILGMPISFGMAIGVTFVLILIGIVAKANQKKL